MQRNPFLRLLFVLSLVGLLLLPSQWLTMASPLSLSERQMTPLFQAIGAPNPPIVEPASTTSLLVLYPSDDASVQQGAPTLTDPDNLYLGVGYYQGSSLWANGLVRSYIHFDLSSLPAGSTIISATTRIYHAGGADYPGQERTVNFYRVTDDWNEASVTWNTRPAHAESLGDLTTTYSYQGWLNLDLTDQVRAWSGGSQDNYGLVAIGYEGTPGVYRAFASGETDHSPELRIRYLPPLSPVLDAWPGTLPVLASNTGSPSTHSIHVANVTNGSLDWTANKVGGAAWLTLNDTGGSATPTAPDHLSLTIDASGLTLGFHDTEQIRISSNTPGVEGSPLTVTVSLEVIDHLSGVYLPFAATGGTSSAAPDVVALVVGVADYQYLDPPPSSRDLPDAWGYDLVAPYYDVRDMVSFLQAMGVPPANIIQLGEEAATQQNVLAAFAGLDQKEDKDTIVLFYFSGHGGQTPDTSGDESDGYDEFIAMYDTNTGPGGFVRVLTDDDLQASLANLESQHIVVIIDSCYSGGMMSAAARSSNTLWQRGLDNPTKPTRDAIPDTQAALAELVEPGRVIITAGTGDQTTWESSLLQNGVFTYYFLQGLQDDLNDANQNGRISAEEAYWFSKDLVISHVSTITTTPQIPAISDQHFGQVDLTRLP